MKNVLMLFTMAAALLLTGCEGGHKKQTMDMGVIPEKNQVSVIEQLTERHGPDRAELIERGVRQAASFWTTDDGSVDDFVSFCLEHYHGDDESRLELFGALSRNYEYLWGHFNQMMLELTKPLHLNWGPIKPVDVLFGSYAPAAHLSEDLFKNKLAFLTILNFPFYSLDEKNMLGSGWDRQQWAFARMGDLFTSRVPADINQEMSRTGTEADNYVSEYNIVMGRLVNDAGERLFPDNLRLITHWGLRDELKANYDGTPVGLEKQRMIYRVMQRIIDQSIPEKVINNDELSWNPYSNNVYRNGEVLSVTPEPDTRYAYLLRNFHARRAADPYAPAYPTAIDRAFAQGLELGIDEVEAMFTELVSDPVLGDVGALISRRLGRELEPFDIWYDGFKARSGIPEAELDRIVRARYPDAEALDQGLPGLLVKLGYSRQRAEVLAGKIVVEGARGAGHAWGAQMRSQNSYLRTRIADDGMTYNGFNIAAHELGHNVEQTISLHDVDHYLLSGIPNTAFTEALAFIFQVRDLELLGITSDDPMKEHLQTLDVLWGTYEIMGVSLVDMRVWRWMYDNPKASAEQLREQTMQVATEVWNDYFAPVFGIKDTPILAIYSHMISYPLYLSAYPLGHLIEFQIEEHIRGKNLAGEIDRMFSTGRLTPGQWMQEAVGAPLSPRPMINAARRSVAALQQ
ncbi:MAG: hypothetical protein RG741_09460 [Bacteroidales bacterium]|nr:hypothetical protein [Bacteroidales bacterium]